jgi:hypothetical protein
VLHKGKPRLGGQDGASKTGVDGGPVAIRKSVFGLPEKTKDVPGQIVPWLVASGIELRDRRLFSLGGHVAAAVNVAA